jgi:uncharacterized protein YbaP (TraB family)
VLLERLDLRSGLVLALAILSAVRSAEAVSCVWKVEGPNGGTLYLGGSIHALRNIDYPLPSAYNRAFDASGRLAFEVDRRALLESSKGLVKAGEYPRGDSLKNHVDPRTYDYLRRLFALLRVPEQKFSKWRPWFLALLLQSPSLHGLSEQLGVEEFLMKRARANSKPVSGLESAREHMEIFSGLTDRQSEACLLLEFIPSNEGKGAGGRLLKAWRRGDADAMAREFHESFRDFPSLGKRLLDVRNRNWIPKIEGYLGSGQTYFVVVGAAHMGGTDGLLALLRARGCKIEQL